MVYKNDIQVMKIKKKYKNFCSFALFKKLKKNYINSTLKKINGKKN